MQLGTPGGRCGKTGAYFNALDGLNAHQRSGQPAIQGAVTLAVAAYSRRQAEYFYFKDSAHRITDILGLFYFIDHGLRSLGVGAIHRRFKYRFFQVPGIQFRCQGFNAAYLHHVADQLNTKLLQQLTSYRACGHPCRRFPGAGAFQHVAHVLVSVFNRAG